MTGAAGSAAARAWLAGAVLALAVLAVYAPVLGYPFVVLDDKALVVDNPLVNGGLRAESVARAFRESHTGNWVPLAWLSHMLDVELFGLEPGGHHAVNVALHLLAALLLLAAFVRMTGDWAPSAFVAAVFALHPLHVESVAWVSERRDVLSGLWLAACLLLYAGWARAATRRRARGAALLAAFALGLLSKPMLVTLPFALLLLDLWPLRRLDPAAPRSAWPLLREKLPLFALVALAVLATLASQGEAGAVASLEQVPPAARLANAAWSAVAYLGKTLWPLGLSVFYPLELAPSAGRSLLAAALLLALTAGAAWQLRQRPWLLVGWLWYLGMLVPVIGVVQVGSQGMADRYTYLPMIGLSLAVAWSGAELARAPRARPFVIGLAALSLLGWAGLARVQVGVWRDSVTLFEHARAVVGDAPVVLVNLGEAYDDAGRSEEAIVAYRAGLEDFPHARGARTRLGILLAETGRNAEAVEELQRAIRRHPDERGARVALARLALASGQPEAAAELVEQELALEPGSPGAVFVRGELAASQGRGAAAEADLRHALERDPTLAERPALRRDPRVALALSRALAATGRRDQARDEGRRARSLARMAGDPGTLEAASAWLAELGSE